MQTALTLIVAAILIVLVLTVAWSRGASARGSSSRAATAAGETATLTVDGMVCGACAARVGRIATQVDGVHDATVDREQGRAQIAYDPARTSPATVARAIAEAGFQTGVLP
ncbi:MAG: heavy-metal-associated domain-containing protein [Dehalococcoidia bacterium]